MIPEKKSIAIMKELSIDKTKQMLMISGADINNPLLLFLHGGPGTPQIGYVRHYQKELEKHFTVVHWDQRGAGLSYSKRIPQNSMTISHFISDAIQVVQWVLKRFSRTKLYLAGHSWGSLLALHVLQQRPDLFYAYYGISQVVNPHNEESAAYQFIREMSDVRSAGIVSKAIRFIGAPPWDKDIYHHIYRFCVEMSRGGFTHQRRQSLTLFFQMLTGKEYGVKNMHKFLNGLRFSKKHLTGEMYRFNGFTSIPSIKLPCFFISGRHDLIVPAEISKQYYQRLEAPEKRWIQFENSAHTPHIEEPFLFASTLRRHALYHL
ncbi:alpha/beta hydrolase [Bacillus vallismortis]|uniref:alpha/beta fold hydrolase n=1 Tax=Bacillus vallismortis TaxID=72361 RepID=UPI00227DF0F3|nr:alpha/beta hydrolase [Bacillus vallismortis]MCY8310859.1 alpha/beta hydrolase [Bacillus vallismortis]MCY8425860.1 alpha/beta hydrolase [Bacillus vallismortis]MCY8534570.1 alpha/beta hydrolase [Bacillus vallismortis]